MKRVLLVPIVLAGLALRGHAATFDYQGITYFSTDTVLKARVGETTRGYYYFDPCINTYSWADSCSIRSFPTDPEPWYGTYNWVSYAEVGSGTGFGTYALLTFDYIPEFADVVESLRFDGEIWGGAWEDDGNGGVYWNMNSYPTRATISVDVAAAVPVPATGALVMAGLGVLALLRRRRLATG